MNLLALHLGKNASAALAVRGRVVGAVGQERVDGIKNTSAPPREAARWLLKEAQLDVRALDAVIVCGDGDASDLPGLAEKVIHLDKPTCLAYAPVAFFPEVGEPWLILTADATGGWLSTWDGAKMTRLAAIPGSCALGAFYGAATAHLGMMPGEHDYKVMGLAAYARPDEVARVRDKILSDFFHVDGLAFKARLAMEEMPSFLKENACGIRFDVLAGAFQSCLEDAVLRWARSAMVQTGIFRLMTSGSVFMNVKLNKRLREESGAEHIRLMPSCGDEVAPFGGLYAYAHERGEALEPIQTLYLGPAFEAREIEELLKAQAFAYTVSEKIEEDVADLLAQGHVVARFAGRAEYGARSLGNRAILAHPGQRESFFKVNDGIKRRDFWMPFAPTILDVDAPRYLVGPVEAPYMIDAFTATEEGRRDLCAALHPGDGTVRPQILRRAENPAFYGLIEAFKAKTGIGAVLNTSLNLHGEPLATTPEQALSTLRRAVIPFMAMERALVRQGE